MGFCHAGHGQLIDYVLSRPNATEQERELRAGRGQPAALLRLVRLCRHRRGARRRECRCSWISAASAPGGGAAAPAHARGAQCSSRSRAGDSSPRHLRCCAGCRAKSPNCAASRWAWTYRTPAARMDLALITRFDSLADMQRYQDHPEHAVPRYLRTRARSSIRGRRLRATLSAGGSSQKRTNDGGASALSGTPCNDH